MRCRRHASVLIARPEPQLAQVVQAGPVSGGEDDRVDRFAPAIAPHDPLAVERDEHRTSVDAALGEGLFEPDAIGHDAAAGDLAHQTAGSVSNPVSRNQ